MKIPYANAAVVQEDKITNYLLAEWHSRGSDKAEFFQRFGFRADQWQVLADALRKHGTQHEVTGTRDSPFGTRYIVEGALETPHGTRPLVRSVWIVETGTSFPRLVSAYPLAERT
ncbi:MAG: hypothetical protein HY423_08710 [Candidatus Lambdaproteobacteria bacterium]|nr:hypothetical protein [Candidatus Lambdaproteobacteria bacterium]